MTRLAAILALCATPALSQGYPISSGDPDRLEISMEGAASALVTYYNSAYKNSDHLTRTMQVEGISVEVQIIVGGGNGEDELFIVRPHGGFIAIPAQISVPDGETATIQVLAPMY